MSKPRPLSVTIISRLLIVLNTIALIRLTGSLQTSESLGVSMSQSLVCVMLGAQVLCGIWMLRGRRFARTLYVCVLLIGDALIFLGRGLPPSQLALQLFVDLTMIYFLYRPNASAFFGASRREKRS
jgi:hypothetical protein